jgi:hypothetical protein
VRKIFKERRPMMRMKRLFLVGILCMAACATHRTVVVREGREGWERLGEREVNGGVDYDTIQVGAREGRFRKIMLVVEDSAVEMFGMTVHFGDGSDFSPPTRLVFAKDSRSHTIDLPGDQRVITRVDFKYGNLAGGGNAHVELWGR